AHASGHRVPAASRGADSPARRADQGARARRSRASAQGGRTAEAATRAVRRLRAVRRRDRSALRRRAGRRGQRARRRARRAAGAARAAEARARAGRSRARTRAHGSRHRRPRPRHRARRRPHGRHRRRVARRRRMSRSTSRVVTLFVLAALAAAAGCQKHGADDGPYADKVADDVPLIEHALGVKFKRPPKLAIRSREQVREFLLAALKTPDAQKQIANEETLYKLLGMLPDRMHLADFYVRVLTEQIIGYYDPKTK